MEDSLKEAMLRDLDIQWKDHFHMRDQTWKTLTNSALLFLGVVGLEIKEISDSVMIPAYAVLIVITVIGCIVAAHHRVRQAQKFAFIKQYEKTLGLFTLKERILEEADSKTGIIGRIGRIRGRP